MEASVPATASVFSASFFAASVFASVPAADACDVLPAVSLEPHPASSVPAMATHNTEASNLFFMLFSSLTPMFSVFFFLS
jgi:hypothetical protein